MQFHKKLKMSLKIAKFINKHLKVYIQEYNYISKQQWLFLKYHNALLISKHPIKYFKKPTTNHVCCCSMQRFINITEKWHIYSKTRNGGTVENGILEHQIQNSKTRLQKPNPGQTASIASLSQINQE